MCVDILKLKTEAGLFEEMVSSEQTTKGDIKSIDATDGGGWTFLKKTDHVELWKKSTEGSAVNLVKVCAE